MARLRHVVLVHYHELGLKRGNRPLFLRHLARNLRRATSDLGPVNLRQVSGRLLLELDEHPDDGWLATDGFACAASRARRSRTASCRRWRR
jgi:adenylyl- and sulfurtransferase ThiI